MGYLSTKMFTIDIIPHAGIFVEFDNLAVRCKIVATILQFAAK